MHIDRRTVASALLLGTLGTKAGMAEAATRRPPKIRNIVLLHGLFVDGSSWSRVITRLQAHGFNVTAVQNPLTTVEEAAAACERALDRQDGPTVLAGHSFSGTIMSQVGGHPQVSSLVYIAARAPDVGEDWSALTMHYPTPPAAAGIVFNGEEGRLTEKAFLRDFAPDLPVQEARALYAAQWPFEKRLMAGRTTSAAWKTKPSYYAVSANDRVIDPKLQRFLAKRMGAHTIEIAASHVSILSHPQRVSDLIVEAATTSVRPR